MSGETGGLMFNQKLMRQMQGRIEKMNQELAELRVESAAGGGMVKAVVNGQQALLSVEINPAVIDPDDVEMLQDLVVAAVNDALSQSRELAAKKLSSVTGGLGLPGL
jgi:DNA-binding YbaB/EbfC family protein